MFFIYSFLYLFTYNIAIYLIFYHIFVKFSFSQLNKWGELFGLDREKYVTGWSKINIKLPGSFGDSLLRM